MKDSGEATGQSADTSETGEMRSFENGSTLKSKLCMPTYLGSGRVGVEAV